jgi:hypothetical protein
VVFDPTSKKANPEVWVVNHRQKSKTDFAGCVEQRFQNYLAYWQILALLSTASLVPISGTVTIALSNKRGRIVSADIESYTGEAEEILACIEGKIEEQFTLLAKNSSPTDSFEIQFEYTYTQKAA